MADTLSPNPATQKRRLPMVARLQSPTSPFFLGSNDDNRERGQARAAPAAAIQRKSVTLNLLLQRGDPNHGLGEAQILELFQNCIKLARENKNTWELTLIDHLTDIISVEEEKDAEPNFQKLRSLVDRFDEDNRSPPDIYIYIHVIKNQQSKLMLPIAMKLILIVMYLIITGTGIMIMMTKQASWRRTLTVKVQISLVIMRMNSFHDNFQLLWNNEPGAYHELDMDERLEKVDGFLFLSLGFISKQNAWVGPDHWKHRKIKVSENNRPAEQPVTVKQKKTKAQQDLDFTKSLEEEFSDIFVPPKNPKSLLLPASGAPCNTKLPEDCHY
ncbi:hypothetical protein C1H46_012874 [Malus baccata]|uniref:Condensin complex subunit 2 n=1 Tax=Malus baccata TaxID=106549 RepID=A0A540MRW4_MALBA|nr:hypothetical protein C1H46_012874 [Malus baccata]